MNHGSQNTSGDVVSYFKQFYYTLYATNVAKFELKSTLLTKLMKNIMAALMILLHKCSRLNKGHGQFLSHFSYRYTMGHQDMKKPFFELQN